MYSPADWLRFNNDYQGRRYSPLAQITSANISTLTPKCLFQTGEVGGFQTSPLIFDGRLYVTTAHSVYALDADTCQKIWSYEYLGSDAAPLPNNRGAALYKGMLFRGTLDGHLIALDAVNGKLLWNVRVCDATKGNFISAAPVAFNGKVFIGDAGADFGGTARVYAFDAVSGRSIWTFDLVPGGRQTGAETWGKDSGRNGGSVWATITVEPEPHRLYVSVGNPGSDLDGSDRPGDNLYTDAVVVLDAESGSLQWYAQQNPHDLHDWDTAAAPALYDQDGRHYMAVGSKDARLYIYDRDSHQLIARKDLTRRENDTLPLTAAGVHICPGILGGVEWNGPAYDPNSRLVFINSVDWCVTLRTKDAKIENPGMAGGFKLDPVSDAHGSLHAFDAASGDEKWVYNAGMPMLAGVTPTASGLTFTGSTDGSLLAFDSQTGRKLYSFYTGGAIAGGISTYMVEGRQYVAVPSGNSSKSMWQSRGAATVIVFGLPL
jgi:PQQ-dependent dehydrogenase (methanol/ethanol family)